MAKRRKSRARKSTTGGRCERIKIGRKTIMMRRRANGKFAGKCR
jgi:hypothetical protein